MGKIADNLTKVEKIMTGTDKAKKDELGRVLRNAAINAIMGGIGSDEWKTYMSMFADSDEQLTRLTVPPASGQQWLREAQAYIVTNAICSGDTTTKTRLGVKNVADLDKGVSDTASDSVKNRRPAEFQILVP